MEHFTLSEQARLILIGPPGSERDSWAFRIDGNEVGEVYTGGTGGYMGRLYAPEGPDRIAAYTTPEYLTKSQVFFMLTRVALRQWAKEKGVDIDLHDIDDVSTGYPEIDGMPAYQWIDAMTME